MSETNLTTFALDDGLPPLPVPTLAETCARYLETVEPLVDAAAFAEAKAAVAELQAPGGTGEKLQAMLEARARDRDNWLSGWWEQYAYLAWPDPIVVNSSIGISGQPDDAPGDQAERAAIITRGALEFYKGILDETLPPEQQKDGSGLDMSLLKRFMAATRMPGTKGDRIVAYPVEEARHIVVIRRGRYYEVEVLSEDDHKIAESAHLRAQFAAIIAAADAAELPPAVGVLTADNRPDWSRERDRLALDPVNRRALDRIDRAIFLVCLDDEAHDTPEKLARAGLHGAKGNRWHDKSLHLIIDADGRFTLHGEHSPVDAGAWVPLIDAIAPLKGPIPAAADPYRAGEPVELTWRLWPETREAIGRAEAVYDGLVENLDLVIMPFTDFGKATIKTFRTGPDPVIQMAFMLAYHRRYGRLPKTYEAASTRMYKGGRTETIRTASNEALALARAMDDAAATSGQKHELIRAAFAEHSKRGRDASAAQAVDRHLFGLKILAQENGIELPALFGQEIYTRGWELSTAQIPLRNGFVNHFGPVCPTGYGVGYVIHDGQINFNLTSWRSCESTDSAAFAADIAQAMRDIRDVLVQASASEAA